MSPQDLEKEMKTRTIGYISAALGLVAGLAWNEAITALIEKLFPLSKDTLAVKFFYAALVTLAVVILVKSLDKFITKDHGSKQG